VHLLVMCRSSVEGFKGIASDVGYWRTNEISGGAALGTKRMSKALQSP